jgi:glycosyltransferase involved in cell wall biosynthesis
MFSRVAINADSCYNVIRSFVSRVHATRDDILFDIMWPTNGKDWKYFRDGFFDLPRVKRIPYRFHAGKMKQVVTYDPFQMEQFFDYKVPYDVIWNHVPEVGDLFKHHVPSYNASGKSVVVNAHHYVVHDSLPYPVEKDQPHIMLHQLTGSFGVDANVFDSQHCRDMFFDNAQKYLSQRTLQSISETAVDIPHGVLDETELRPLMEIPRADVFTFAYNHRLQAYKNYHTTFEIFDTLYGEGLKFKVILFGMPDAIEHFSDLAKRPYVETYVSETRDAYLKKLATCHANMLNSQHETFCISAVESMALGQILIAPNSVTFPEITGKSSTNAAYPFLFDNTSEQLEMCRKLISDAHIGGEWSAFLLSHVWENYNTHRWTDTYMSLFDRLTNQFDVLRALKPTSAPIVRLIASQDRWDFQDLRKTLYSAKLGVKRMVGDQSFPSNRIKRLAHQLGFDDMRSARTGELTLVRKRNVDMDEIVRNIVTRTGGGEETNAGRDNDDRDGD